jgi:mannobiose 2-epimerase
MAEQNDVFDSAWFRRHLLDDILPRWRAAITEEGLFLPHFDRAWRPVGRGYGTLVSQTRLLFNFSQGYQLTGDRGYLNAVESGSEYLINHFWDHTHGGWYWQCGLDGTIHDRHKDAYGHAFAILGLSHAYGCTRATILRESMLDTWEILGDRFRDHFGGYRWRMTESFEPAEQVKSQNPIMHLFEALMAAGTAGEVPELLSEARNTGDFVLNKLVRQNDRRLPEVYDDEWQEMAAKSDWETTGGPLSGGRLDIGHAFEWAFLAASASELGFPAYYRSYANSFIGYGLALGFDWQAGGIYSPASPNGRLMSKRKGWWEQCEAARALLHFAAQYGRDDLVEALELTLNFVSRNLIDSKHGGWYEGVDEHGTPETRFKGSEWKLDYHVAGLCLEGIRNADQLYCA